MRFTRLFIIGGLFGLFFNTSIFAQQNGSLSGQVVDQLGAVVVGASVRVVSAGGIEKTTISNQRGEFTVTALAPGKYTVRVSAQKFALYENTQVEIAAGKRAELTVSMAVEGVQEKIEVASDKGVSTDPQRNAGATVLKERELEALPDDPDELEAALQALAGPAAGPHGGQIYIDGFTGGRLPSKETIREIRINSNPLSAEYDRPGFGRIEILTKPGADRFRGSAFGIFNGESLNSRNPFALNRAPSQTRFFGGNISGPIQKRKSSFFVDISNRDVDNNVVVNAVLLDSLLNPVSFREEVQVPSRRFSVSPRFDYAINDRNTLVARFSFERVSFENQGIGNTTLPSRAYETNNVRRELRLTETMFINPTTINETRFEYSREKREQAGDNSIPAITVVDAFSGGGSQIGLSFNRSNAWEVQNYTTTSVGASTHLIKFGVRLRGISLRDRSENNYGGSFTFAGSPEVRSPAGCARFGPGCVEVAPALSPIDQYRGRLFGNPDSRFYPTQFSITTGQTEQDVSGADVGLFVSDDWRVNPGLTLSFGLRYENQTNISDKSNFAPRFTFAWSPGSDLVRKTVFRGGFGIFYDRFSENLTLQALRFNGSSSSQLNLVVNADDPDPVRRAAALALLQQPVFTLTGVTNVPTAAQILAVLPQSNTIRSVADDLKSPMTLQAVFGVERKLPMNLTGAAFYLSSRTYNFLRSRNINAPICPEQNNCLNAPRPAPALGNIYEYESTGILNQNRLFVNIRNNYNRKFSLFAIYSLGFSNSDADGAGSFPAYSYDLANEYGRQALDIRHNFIIGGNFNLPYGFSMSPFLMANSGRPFNITRGIDVNGDALFTERPTFGELAARCSELGLTASYCDVAGKDRNAIIPRNYGQSPNSFVINLRVGKNFGFGNWPRPVAASGQRGGAGADGGGHAPPVGAHGPGGGGPPGGSGSPHGPGGGGDPGPGGGGGDSGKRYNLNFSINFNNLLNTVNLGTPIGTLNSNRFGQSIGTAGSFGGFGGGGGTSAANRRIELQVRFSW
jgi:hypothetical protein